MGCIWSCEGDDRSRVSSHKASTHRATAAFGLHAAPTAPPATSSTVRRVVPAYDYGYTTSWTPTVNSHITAKKPPAYRPPSPVRVVHTTCQWNTAKLNLIADRPISQQTKAEIYGFGEFRCPCCRRYWESRKAWKTKEQGCTKCDEYCTKHNTKECAQSYVLPTLWRPLTAAEKVADRTADHKQSLCNMCKKLGHNCGKKPKRNNRRSKESSGPRYIARKRHNLPHRPPSYNASVRSQTFTGKRFRKY